jgi:hypothetical protein
MLRLSGDVGSRLKHAIEVDDAGIAMGRRQCEFTFQALAGG